MRHIDLLRGVQTLARASTSAHPPGWLHLSWIAVTVAGNWMTTMTEGHLRACLAVAVRLVCMTARQRMCVCLFLLVQTAFLFHCTSPRLGP